MAQNNCRINGPGVKCLDRPIFGAIDLCSVPATSNCLKAGTFKSKSNIKPAYARREISQASI